MYIVCLIVLSIDSVDSVVLDSPLVQESSEYSLRISLPGLYSSAYPVIYWGFPCQLCSDLWGGVPMDLDRLPSHSWGITLWPGWELSCGSENNVQYFWQTFTSPASEQWALEASCPFILYMQGHVLACSRLTVPTCLWKVKSNWILFSLLQNVLLSFGETNWEVTVCVVTQQGRRAFPFCVWQKPRLPIWGTRSWSCQWYWA